jgi:heme/copper-type cytochrome/quinol oxidase subunit 2
MPPDPNLIVREVFSWVVPGLIIIILGFPVVRLITKWLEPRPVPPRELSAINGRLERIEAAVDAIALEVERISESQRFTARLQAEHPSARLPGPSESA